MSADLVAATPRMIAKSPEVARRDAQNQQSVRAFFNFLGGGTGGYQGASSKKRSLREWWPAARSADQDTIPDLPTLRSRSRDLERNSPIAGGAVETVCMSVIGDGLKLSSNVNRKVLGISDDAADDWESQAELIFRTASRQLDLTRVQHLGEMEDMALRTQLVSGDLLVIRRFKKRPGDLLGLKLQFVEADRIATPPQKLGGTKTIDGVERDDDGAHTVYHVRNRHPDDLLRKEGDEWSSVAARGVDSDELQAFLLFDRQRPGQTRGIPYLAPVIEPLKQLERFTDSELMAAVVSSFFTVFVKSETGDGLANQTTEVGLVDDNTIDSRVHDIKLGPASIVDLQAGDDITIADPARPNQRFDPFVDAIMTQIGMRLGIPREVLSKHFKASYSAARAALVEAWRFFRRRRAWFALRFCDPVYEWMITEAVLSGMLNAPGFLNDPIVRRAWLGATWTGPAQGSIDPKKEYEAYGILRDRNWAPDSWITQELRGQDFDEILQSIARDRAVRERFGIPEPPPKGTSNTKVDEPKPEDVPEGEDES